MPVASPPLKTPKTADGSDWEPTELVLFRSTAFGDDQDRPVLSDDEELTLPHPRAHERAFVLRPWIDLQPYGQLPGHGWLTDLLNAPGLAADLAGMTPRPDLSLESTREQ